MDKKIALVILCDDGYVKYAYVMLKTFIDKNPWFNGDVVVICDDKDFKFTENSLNLLKGIYKDIKIHITESNKYQEIKELFNDKVLKKSYLNCFYKYECFNMPEYDRVVFYDCDIMFNGSVEDIFKEEKLTFTKDCDTYLDKIIEYDNSWLNTGCFATSRPYCSIYEKIIDYTINHSGNKADYGLFPEQDVMNEFFQENSYDSLFYPLSYNCFNANRHGIIYSTLDAKELCNGEVKAIHLIAKPLRHVTDETIINNIFLNIADTMPKKKKIAILGLSCNDPDFVFEEQIAKNTWGKEIIDGTYSNMSLYFFRSGEKNEIYENENLITVTTDDRHKYTAEKTKMAIDLLKKSHDFDYIVITNTSTVLNLKLIDNFVNSDYIDKKCYYGGELFYRLRYNPFFRGNFMSWLRENPLLQMWDESSLNKIFCFFKYF